MRSHPPSPHSSGRGLALVGRLRTHPPIGLEVAIQPSLDRVLVLDPEAVFFVVTRISVVATQVHQLAVHADDLRVLVHGPVIVEHAFEAEKRVHSRVDLFVRDAAFVGREPLHDSPDAVSDFPDPGSVVPTAALPLRLLRRQDDVDAPPLVILVGLGLPNPADRFGDCDEEVCGVSYKNKSQSQYRHEILSHESLTDWPNISVPCPFRVVKYFQFFVRTFNQIFVFLDVSLQVLD